MLGFSPLPCNWENPGQFTPRDMFLVEAEPRGPPWVSSQAQRRAGPLRPGLSEQAMHGRVTCLDLAAGILAPAFYPPHSFSCWKIDTLLENMNQKTRKRQLTFGYPLMKHPKTVQWELPLGRYATRRLLHSDRWMVSQGHRTIEHSGRLVRDPNNNQKNDISRNLWK